jgi:voltage-gated potassium channel
MSGASNDVASGDQPRFGASRRHVLRALARALVNTTVLVALYSLLPLDQPVGEATIAWLLAGLLTFAVLVVLQIRSILRSRYPVMRAVEALGSAVPLFVLVFASTYLLLAGSQPQAFTEHLSHTDALYFTMAVFSTVGFGDIAPRSDAARLIVTVQMVGNLVVLGALARVVVGAVRMGRQRQADGATIAEHTH